MLNLTMEDWINKNEHRDKHFWEFRRTSKPASYATLFRIKTKVFWYESLTFSSVIYTKTNCWNVPIMVIELTTAYRKM